MTWSPSVLSVLAFLAAGIFGVLIGVAWRRQESEATPFIALMFAVFLWASIYGIQLGFTTAAEQLPWQRATLAISGTVPVLLLWFAKRYAGAQGWITRRILGLLAWEAIVFAGLSLTNPIHHFILSDASLESGFASPVLGLQFAGGYMLHILIAYATVAIALWTILSIYFRSPSLYRRQAALLLVGAVPAFGAHILYTLGAGPIPGLDMTPFLFTVMGVTFGLALFHFDLLDRRPIAQRRAIELTGDGLLVVDVDGLVVFSNDIARQLFEFDDTEKVHFSSITGTTDLSNLDRTTISGVINGTQHVYDIHVTTLTGNWAPQAGSAVVVRDVTDRDTYQKRLEVTNRVLRHNLRNDMNVILGNAELLAEEVPTTEQQKLAKTIQQTAEDLVELSEKARELVRSEDSQHHENTVYIDEVLTPLIARFRETYPAVTVLLECPDDARVTGISEREITVALWNLLENAAEHNDTTSLSVEMTVSCEGHRTQVMISDTGSGLPEMEQRVLEGYSETPLQHGSGLGLWLTYWIVTSSNCEIVVDSAGTDGTAISVTLPMPDTSACSGAT